MATHKNDDRQAKSPTKKSSPDDSPLSRIARQAARQESPPARRPPRPGGTARPAAETQPRTPSPRPRSLGPVREATPVEMPQLTAGEDGRQTFAQNFYRELAKEPTQAPPAGHCRTTGPTPRNCNLCCAVNFDYAHESAAKARALAQWCVQDGSLPTPQWVPAPQGRFYRSVSKRRWLSREKKLIMTEDVLYGHVRGVTVSACQQEPPQHAKIYADLQKQLPNSRLGEELNYAILKGGVDQYHLLLNMTDFRQRRAEVNRLSKKLTQANPNLKSIWVVQGRPDDDYYLNPAPGAWERIHGPKSIVAANGLHFSPLCFTQVNPPMVPILLKTVSEWLDDPAIPLLDLYCGYGLFALSLQRSAPVVGLELSREAISWAKQNATHRRSKTFFSFCDLDNIELTAYTRRLPPGPLVAVVDPPRGGASPQLVAQLAEIGPQRVVHLVCDVEKTFAQAALWSEQGYAVERLVGLDMFPGTPCLEVALCLQRR